MNFGEGAENFTISGGKFMNIKGNHTVFNHNGNINNHWGNVNNIKNHRGDINNINGNYVQGSNGHGINANDRYAHNTMNDPYNGNSQRTDPRGRYRSEPDHWEEDDMGSMHSTSTDYRDEDHWNPQSRLGRDRRDDEMYSTSTDYTGPRSSQRSQSTGRNVKNINSFNSNNTHVNDAFNDRSRMYQYYSRPPPTNQRHRDRPKNMPMYEEGSIPDIDYDDDRQSNSGSLGNGQVKKSAQAPKQPKSRQHMGGGKRSSGSSSTVHSPLVQRMSPNNAFGGHSREHQYDHAPPTNRDRPQQQSISEEDILSYVEEDEDLQSTSGSFRNGQIKAPVQLPSQPRSRQHMGTSMRSGPPTTADRHSVQHLAESYEPDDADSTSSHSIRAQHPLDTSMATLLIHDPMSSPRSRDKAPLKIVTHPSPSTGIARGRSNPQQPTTLQVKHPMGHLKSNSSPYIDTHHNFYSNPSLTPPLISTSRSNPRSSSSDSPIARTVYEGLTQHDTIGYQANRASFDVENNSLVDSSGKRMKENKKKRPFWSKLLPKSRQDSGFQ